MSEEARHILLIGGGHAHVAVLADWARYGLPCARATLLTPNPSLRYSGMVPGWISGQYARDEGLVDLAALADRAGVKLVLDRCVGLDPGNNSAATEEHGNIAFDIASIDTGGVGRARAVLGNDPRLIDVRPIDGFVERIAEFGHARQIAVIGGGAGGVELAFALNNRADFNGATVTLVTGASGLLPDHSAAVRRKVAAENARQDVRVIETDADMDGEPLASADLIVAAIGSGAPHWPRTSGIECDDHGFIAVSSRQLSVSHDHIFAVGDVAARQDRPIPHSGVHAVMAGPVVAANLRALAEGRAPSDAYRPNWANLYLLSTARGEAIASYGPFAAQGRWVAKLKHFIDTRWINRYADLASGV